MEEEKIRIYTDGSCLWNPWNWWYAAILLYKDNSKTVKWGEKNTTNNRMELKAIISALKELKKSNIHIEVYTDSNYVYKWITQYIKNWKNNNWKTSDKQDVKNKDLWEELYELNLKFKIKRNWVKWHADDQLNNLVDKIAQKEAKKFEK